MKPSNKITAAAGAAAATTVVVWLLTLAGVDVPGEVQGAFTVLLVFAAGYLTTDKTAGRHQLGDDDNAA